MPDANLFKIFTVRLDKVGIRYMVTGAVDAIIYGELRLSNLGSFSGIRYCEEARPASAPSRQSGIGRGKGHNQNSISLLAFRSPLRAPGSPGVPVPS